MPTLTPDGLLPRGIHTASWEEFKQAYGMTGTRRALLRGLEKALVALKASGCPTVYVDGSFVTGKVKPNDYDACWDPTGVDVVALQKLAPELFVFDRERQTQKRVFGGELFPPLGPQRGSLPISPTRNSFSRGETAQRKGSSLWT